MPKPSNRTSTGPLQTDPGGFAGTIMERTLRGHPI